MYNVVPIIPVHISN